MLQEGAESLHLMGVYLFRGNSQHCSGWIKAHALGLVLCLEMAALAW